PDEGYLADRRLPPAGRTAAVLRGHDPREARPLPDECPRLRGRAPAEGQPVRAGSAGPAQGRPRDIPGLGGPGWGTARPARRPPPSPRAGPAGRWGAPAFFPPGGRLPPLPAKVKVHPPPARPRAARPSRGLGPGAPRRRPEKNPPQSATPTGDG